MKEISLEFLNDLNDNQRKAVINLSKPLYVVAGAGTGKTKTLTAKVAYLLAKGFNPRNLLVVTFTNKAAEQMQERIRTLLNYQVSLPFLLTFHKFCVRILKNYITALGLGFTNDFTIIDQDDLYGIVKNIIDKLGYDKEKYPHRKISKEIYNVLITQAEKNVPFEYELYYCGSSYRPDYIRKIVMEYQQYQIDNNVLYFDDLLIYTKELLQNNEEIRQKLEDKFEFILVDEFQDTDELQYQILTLLRQKRSEIFVVGDPDQSIYSFRGADYRNNQRFIAQFDAQIVTLDQNYRSTKKILDVANNLIENNPQGDISKKLYSNKLDGQSVELKSFDTDLLELDYICNKINYLVKYKNYKYSDFSVLYRVNHLSALLEKTFTKYKIPYKLLSKTSFFQRAEIKDVLSYLYLISGNINDFYVKRVINIPKRGIGDASFNKLLSLAKEKQTNILEVIDQVSNPSTKLLEFKDLILQAQNLIEKDYNYDIINHILEEFEYKQYLKKKYPIDYTDRIKNVEELKTLIFQSNNSSQSISLKDKIKATLEEISLVTSNDNVDLNSDAVNLSTVHQVKGLEFNIVFIYALNDGLFPSRGSDFNGADLEEERRVCYVAVTRAKKELYLTYSKNRAVFGKIQEFFPSIFVEETGLLKLPDRIISPTRPKIGFQRNYSKTNYYLTQRVEHENYGLGVVTGIDEKYITITFNETGQQKKFPIKSGSIKPYYNKKYN